MNTLLSMAQIGCEEITQPEYLTFYSSYEEYMKDLINWCNLIDNAKKRGKKKRKRERRKKKN